ncbi:MAG TPA: Ig-like domain-containing protein, partial [Terracidiphilus sp.]|nr:Ig-like domain-containing protein [Terracidiphilus sp.]
QSASVGATTTPTGSVSFYLGSTLLDTASLTGDSTSFITTLLPVGVNSLTAVYSGNADFNSSTSSIVSVTILNKANSSVTLTAVPTTALAGNLVTITAVVKSATENFRATPTGLVSFYLGSTPLGSASLSAGSASFFTSQLPVGVDSITADYTGSPDFNSSNSSTVSITVVKANSTVSLTSSLTTLSAGDSVNFTAVVKSASMGTTAAPTGSVTFVNGSTSLGSAALNAGVASLVTTQLPPGTDSITAVYSGDADFNGSTSTSVSEQVSSFALMLSAGSASVFPGEPAAVTLTASPIGGAFANPITFSASELPAGATASFEPSSITPGNAAQESTLTVQTANQSAAKDSPRFFGLRSVVALCILLPLAGLSRIRREGKYGFRLMLFAIAALAAASAIGGCGGGFFVQPPQTYSITITARSGPVAQSSVFKLTIE